VWVPGGHSWMLPRPQGQGDILRHLRRGREFVAEVLDRRQILLAADGPDEARPHVADVPDGSHIHLLR